MSYNKNVVATHNLKQGGIQMNTETMEQFEVMDEMMLSNIEGGNDVLITAGSAIAGGIVGY